MALRSFQEYYDLFIDRLQSERPDLTDTEEGSLNDLIAGITATAASELQGVSVDEFAKTFFSSANGPEVTQGPDDLENLAVDHFGAAFARPEGSKSTGVVTFSRPTSGAGNVAIGVGTIVKTPVNAAGNSTRFEVVSAVTLTGLSINASVRAVLVGTDGNAQVGTVTQIETTLTDPTVVVTNAAPFAGGEGVEDDATYRETIRNLIETLRGATLSAIKAKALTVPGVEQATPVEFKQYVIEWDIGLEVPIGDYFAIARARLYIADANGTASPTLLDDVRAAIETVRAAGVFVDVVGAVAIVLNWQAQITLNPSGPNYVLFQNDTTKIVDTMIKYIQDLDIGDDFDRGLARLNIMSIWGPSGTDDLTDFITSFPLGNISADPNEKIIPGTLEIV